MKSRGFTLIEFLVALCIIGAVVLAIYGFLKSTQTKGGDSAIKSQLTSLRNGLELYFNDPTKGNNTYGEATITCDNMFADPSVSPTIEDLKKQTGNNVACVTIGDKWGVAAKLKTGGFHCVDSVGASQGSTLNGNPYDGLIGDNTTAGFSALDISTSLCRN